MNDFTKGVLFLNVKNLIKNVELYPRLGPQGKVWVNYVVLMQAGVSIATVFAVGDYCCELSIK